MKTDKIIVWGTGQNAKEFVKAFGTDRIVCFADNNEKLFGETFMGRRIVSFDEILMSKQKYMIVIATEKYEQKIKRQLISSNYDLFINAAQYKIDMIFGKCRQSRQRIILMNTHDNINIGDHLITTAELYFFRKYMPERELVEIPLSLCTKELKYIHKYVNKDDLLVITGGGFLGSLWLIGGEVNVRSIVQLFPNNRIIIFPQTMYFEDSSEGKKEKLNSMNIYNKHSNLTFCFRDKVSYELGMQIFSEQIIKIYIPDIAMLLDRSDEIYLRDGILMCMREDKEKVMSNYQVQEIKRKLIRSGLEVREMSMLEDENVAQEDRMDAVNRKLYQIQKSQLVITDRLHCMILCAISGTPCIAFNNLSGKVKGTYHWIEDNPYICVLDDVEDVWDEMQRLLEMNLMAYCNSNISREFDKLAEYIESWGI